MQFDDDNAPSMVNGLLNGMINPNDAVNLNTRIAYDEGHTLPTRKGVYLVMAPSRQAGQGFITSAVKIGEV